MPIFAYTMRGQGGDEKREIEAANIAQATATLRRQGIVPISIGQKSSFDINNIQIPGFGPSV